MVVSEARKGSEKGLGRAQNVRSNSSGRGSKKRSDRGSKLESCSQRSWGKSGAVRMCVHKHVLSKKPTEGENF